MRLAVNVFLYGVCFLCVYWAIPALALQCEYAAKPPEADIKPRGDCGELLDADTLLLGDSHFERLWFGADGLAEVALGEPFTVAYTFNNETLTTTYSPPGPPRSFFLVSANRTIVRMHEYFRAADRFVEGRARFISKSKMGYVDTVLSVVIPPRYDFAFPFYNGHAIVCHGCSRAYNATTREYAKVSGGEWGIIDSRGEEVLPVSVPYAAFMESDLRIRMFPRRYFWRRE